MPITLESVKDLEPYIGREVAVSDWHEITQARINTFADASGDHQWIHVDPERAKRESPFGAPVAHGFLTLSVLSWLLADAVRFAHIRMGVNYGLNRVRFTAPVPAGGRVRAHFAVKVIEPIPMNGAQITWDVSMELEGSDKPCLVAEWLTRRYE